MDDGDPSSRYAGIRNGADFRAFWGVEVPLAFGALLGVDDVHVALQRNRGIRTFKFTGSTNGALRGYDLVSHFRSPELSSKELRPTSIKPRAIGYRFEI
jgi:hypothetical protein